MKTQSTAVIKNRYFDSVFLMTVAKRLSEVRGIETAVAVMATAANKRTLVKMGFDDSTFRNAATNDLLVALSGDRPAVDRVLADPERWLVRPKSGLEGSEALSLADALRRQANSNLAVISLPGEYAAPEARAALDQGLNVFLFSDHVSLEDEIALKRQASDAGLIVMGPDCGTALVAGVGIGFANAVRRGPIGVVASSGTGLQEFSCLVHRAGSGISHGFGVGSRDLSDAVGGASARAALAALEKDSGTRAIAVISKPPGESALRRIVERLNECSKPVTACFLGLSSDSSPSGARFEICSTLDDVAVAALRLVGDEPRGSPFLSANELRALAVAEGEKMGAGQRYVRGLFAGGTFCYQSQQVMRDGGIVVSSNAPLGGMRQLEDSYVSVEHTLIDLGADEFTVGTPHPMIDPTQRRRRILAEARDPKVAVLLLDFILGFNSAPDPAGDLAEAIGQAKWEAEEAGRYLSVVASVCGTDGDPQGLERQEAILRSVGAVVFASNVQASAFARSILLEHTGGPNRR